MRARNMATIWPNTVAAAAPCIPIFGTPNRPKIRMGSSIILMMLSLIHISGGMRQRVMIAMALSCSPSLLIADEPTTALDVTIQAQIIDLMVELKKNINASIILITHDMGEMCIRDRSYDTQ